MIIKRSSLDYIKWDMIFESRDIRDMRYLWYGIWDGCLLSRYLYGMLWESIDRVLLFEELHGL